jgi:hypothetical protein
VPKIILTVELQQRKYLQDRLKTISYSDGIFRCNILLRPSFSPIFFAKRRVFRRQCKFFRVGMVSCAQLVIINNKRTITNVKGFAGFENLVTQQSINLGTR